MTIKINNFNVNDLIERHKSGISVNELSKTFGIARVTINRWFEKYGFQWRNQHETEILKWQKMTPEQRFNQTKAAHDAVRGSTRTIEDLSRRAIGKQRTKCYIGQGENEFFDYFIKNNLNAIQQQAFDNYNIDIAIDNSIAVEILFNGTSPLKRKHDIKKIKHLLKYNWIVIYFWFKPKEWFSESNLEYFTSFIKGINRNPSNRSKYFVIRRDGELYSTGCLDSIN